VLHAAGARRQLVIAIALLERGHDRRVGLGQGDLCCAHGRGHPCDPLARRLGEVTQVRLAIEGAIGHQVGGSIRGVSLISDGEEIIKDFQGNPKMTLSGERDAESRP
jgi:hypothetical protein